MNNAKASRILKRMESYELYDGIKGKDGVYYAEDHDRAYRYYKTTVENYVAGNSEENEVWMTAKEVLAELTS